MSKKADKTPKGVSGVAEMPQTQAQPQYVVPANEKHLFHCVIEVKKFNPETGERLSKPRIQKFGQKTFEMVLPKLREQGYTVTILHNPRG
jgi:hypothetical protein